MLGNTRNPFESLVEQFQWPMKDTMMMGWQPLGDIEETDESYIITADVPGFGAEDISVDVDDRSVTISAEQTSDTSDEEGVYLTRERYTNMFNRTFQLPHEVVSERAEATYNNGVLRIELGKVMEGNTRHHLSIQEADELEE